MENNNLKKYFILNILCFLILLLCVIAYGKSSINDEFIEAVEDGDIYLVDKMLKNGADINYVDSNGEYTALSVATASGNAELVEYLLKNGANPRGSNNYPNQPVYIAITENYSKIVDILIKAGINPNYRWTKTDGSSLLTNAIQFGHYSVVNVLIANGADVNLTGSKGLSPLYRAIISNQYDLMLLLLDHNAKLNENDKLALKKLNWFEDSRNHEIISLLKNKNALGKEME